MRSITVWLLVIVATAACVRADTYYDYGEAYDDSDESDESYDSDDLDESDEVCGVNGDRCDHACIISEGIARCVCNKGFVLDAEDKRTCLDIDECPTVTCEHGCINTPGSYYCKEILVYRPSTTTTTTATTSTIGSTTVAPFTTVSIFDVEENLCVAHGCSHDCLVNSGDVIGCICPFGFDFEYDDDDDDDEDEDPKICVDVDECAGEIGDADGDADDDADGYSEYDYNFREARLCSHECVNTVGSYECRCPEPMYLDADGSSCKCPPGTSPSRNNTACLQHCPPGTSLADDEMSCDCPKGYERSDETDECLDVDECLGDPCTHDCVNVPGSFLCTCPDVMAPSNDNKSCLKKVCSEGYEMSTTDGECIDIDECLQDVCTHVCVNLPGSYSCRCPQGMTLSDDNKSCVKNCSLGYATSVFKDECVDVNECLDDPCSHECVNTDGSFVCKCPELYYLNADKLTCSRNCSLFGCRNGCDDNKCVCLEDHVYLNENNTSCIKDVCKQSTCSHGCIGSAAGTFTCECPEGMILLNETTCSCPDNYLLSSKLTCEPMDICTIDNGGCAQICDTNIGCSCRPGYTLSVNGKTCDDIDECLLSFCDHECTNNKGGYECSCRFGYVLVNHNTCQDVDECKEGAHNCSHVCLNLKGSYECACPDGYRLDEEGKDCVPSSSCASNNGGCSQVCVSDDVSHHCECLAGFVLNSDLISCIDIDECETQRHNCSHVCVNTMGSFDCECPEGFALNENGTECADIDECEDTLDECSDLCINTEGSYVCTCASGYVMSDNITCVDVDECSSGPVCDHVCENIPGGYVCRCRDGFDLAGDGRSCLDIDECAYNETVCAHECVNYDGGFECRCPKGYAPRDDGAACLRSCLADNGGCSQLCTGDGECLCFDGFEKDPANDSLCHDVDECRVGEFCEHTCINTPGSYRCECHAGYVSDDDKCRDVDECDAETTPCPDDTAHCINTIGSFKCECIKGYVASTNGSYPACIASQKRCGQIISPVHGYMKCSSIDAPAPGTECHFWCEKGYKLTGSAARRCDEHGAWDGFNAQCIPRPCPALPKPKHGHFIPPECNEDGDKMLPSDYCSLMCDPGYKPYGARIMTCTKASKWTPYNATLECVKNRPTIRPFIRCPMSFHVDLRSSHNQVRVVIPRPISNMDWNRYIDADPAWAKNQVHNLSPGTTTIIYKARNPQNDTSVSCTFSITVVDTEKPKVVYCPDAIEIRLNPGEITRSVSWKEPQFSDNLEVVDVHKSKLPGSWIGKGIHHIDYIAKDASGNRAQCHFTINVIEADEDASEYRMREGVMICPGHPPVKFVPDRMGQIPRGCRVKWIKSDPHTDYSNRQGRSDSKLKFYDDWGGPRYTSSRYRAGGRGDDYGFYYPY